MADRPPEGCGLPGIFEGMENAGWISAFVLAGTVPAFAPAILYAALRDPVPAGRAIDWMVKFAYDTLRRAAPHLPNLAIIEET